MPNAHLLRNLLTHSCAAEHRAGTVPNTAALTALVVLAAFAIPAHSGLLDGLGRAGEAISRSEGAVSAGQQVMSTGRQAMDAGRQTWDGRNVIPFQPPSGAAVMARDEGGPVRLIAALERGAGDPVAAGSTLVALLDQGAYFVQRQTAHVTTPQDQLLATPAQTALRCPSTCRRLHRGPSSTWLRAEYELQALA